MKKITIYLSAAILTVACHSRSGQQAGGPVETYEIGYAKGFRVEKHGGYTDIQVRNPWDTTKLLQRYLLVPDSLPLPDDLPKGTLVRTPLKRVVVYSSVHCGIMDVLGLHTELAGVCESRYVAIDFVKKGIADGTIADVGEAFSPNVEKIIDLAPDAIITTPLENTNYGRVEKIGVPLIEITDYMELTPLGRAEWIRFFSLFFGEETRADSLFNRTVSAYNEVKALAAKAEKRPTVLPEKKTGSAWYVPGGGSFMANLYRDAGAEYPWSDNTTSGSIPMSIENVLERGAHADIWIVKYNHPNDMTYTDLKNEYAGYENFAAFKNRSIFACNTNSAPYYEELPIHPEYVLKDLVWVFHPELLPGYESRYFKKMKE